MISFGEPLFSGVASPLAYLNPGTGGMIIQLVLGTLFALGLAVRIFWGRIKTLLHLSNDKTQGNPPQDGDGNS